MKKLFTMLLLLAGLTPLAALAHEDAQAYLRRGAYNEAYIVARASGDEDVMRSALEQIARRPELWRVRWEEGRAGYADVSGTWRISPQFKSARDFGEEGYAIVRQEKDRMGVIDRTGAYAVPPVWERVRAVRDGYAVVCEREDGWGRYKFGIVDLTGRVVIEPKYDYLEPPSEGLIVAGRQGYHMGYLNLEGEWAIGQHFSQVTSFRDGVARVWEPGAEKYARTGLIDKAGNWVERPKWQDITEPDAEGRRFVCKQTGGRWGLIGADGLWIVRPRWVAVREPDGAGSRAALVDGLWGLIDADGGWLVKPCWTNVSRPDDGGVRAVQAADGLWGLINPDGSWLTQQKFDYEWLDAFCDYGYALFRDAQGIGALDSAYRVAWYVPGDWRIGNYRDGVAPIEEYKESYGQEHEEGYVDFLGNLLWTGKKEN